jgi:hypothetical protein
MILLEQLLAILFVRWNVTVLGSFRMRYSLRSGVFLSALMASGLLSASSTKAADPIPSSIGVSRSPSKINPALQLDASPLGPFQLPLGTTQNQLGIPKDSPDTPQPNPIPQVHRKQTDSIPQVHPKTGDSFQLPPRPLQPEPKIRRYKPPTLGADGEVQGQVTISSVCSVVSAAKDCVSRPYVGTLKVMSLDRSQTLRVETDQQGEFELRLNPGLYIVEPETGSFPALTQQTVRIVSGANRTEDLVFEGSGVNDTSTRQGSIQEGTLQPRNIRQGTLR